MQKRYMGLVIVLLSFFSTAIASSCINSDAAKRPFRTMANNQAFPIIKYPFLGTEGILSSLCAIKADNACICKKLDIISEQIVDLRIELNYLFEDLVTKIQECCEEIRMELNYIFDDLTKIIINVSSSVERCCAMLSSVIEDSSTLVVSVIDNSTDIIVSKIDNCCDHLTSVIDNSTNSISVIDRTVTSLIDQSTTTILSTLDECCSHLTSAIDNSTNNISIIDRTVTSLIDQSTTIILSNLEECCNHLTSVIDNSTNTISVIDRTITSLIDQSTDTIVSTLDECCEHLTSQLDRIELKIDLIGGSALEDVVIQVEFLNSVLDHIIDTSIEISFLLSIIEELSIDILFNISNIDQIFEATISAVDACCMSLTETINESTEEIVSKIEDCCGMILSAVDNQTNTVSIIDNTITSIIDQSTETLFSKIEDCCGMILSSIDNQVSTLDNTAEIVSAIDACCRSLTDQITNSTNTTANNITNSTNITANNITTSTAITANNITNATNTINNSINNAVSEINNNIDAETDVILSGLEECCNHLTSELERIELKIDLIGGSALEDVVMQVEFLNSVLDHIIDTSIEISFLLSIIEELSIDILFNISNLDQIFEATISAVDACCMSLTETINESTTEIFSKIEDCCEMILSAVDNQTITVSVVDNVIASVIDHSTDVILSKIDDCCNHLTSVIDNQTIAVSIIDSTITSIIDQSTEVIFSKIEECCDMILSAVDNQTNTVSIIDRTLTSLIDNSTEVIVSTIDNCCDHLTSQLDTIELKIDLIGGSALEDVVIQVEFLNSVLDHIIDTSLEISFLLSIVEELSIDILFNVSHLDQLFSETISAVDACCMSLTDVINESTEEIFSKIEDCCGMILSAVDNQTNTISIIDNTITSIIDQSTEVIFSKIEECCGMILSAVDNQTNTVSVIDNTITSLIDQSTVILFSKIEDCCDMLMSAIDNQCNTVSIADQIFTSAIDLSTAKILSAIDACCTTLSEQIDNSTTEIENAISTSTATTANNITAATAITANNIVNATNILNNSIANSTNTTANNIMNAADDINDNIDDSTDEILSALEECCTHLSSELDRIELKIDLIGGSALEDVVMQVEFLNSVLDQIIDTSLEISFLLSVIEELSIDILFNVSHLDQLFNETISAVDACCMSLTDTINESTELLFSKIEDCCNHLTSAIDNQTNTVSIIDNTLTSLIDRSTDEIFSKIEECCGMIISAVDNQVCTVSAIDNTITSIIDLSTDALFSKIDMCCASILDAVNAGAAMTCSCADIVGEELLSLIESISIQLGDTRIINEFNGPQVIINPGLYTLSSDFMMTSPGEYTFNITAPDVIIDLNNFTIDGNGTSLGGIQVDGVANVTIRNGSIVNSGGIAINITNAMNVLIENVTVNGTATPGGATIVIDSSTLVQLKNVLAFNESGGSVVSIVNSSNTLVQDSTGKSSTGGGFPAGIFSAVGSLATRFVNAIACSPFGLPSTAIGFGISGSTGVGFFGSSAINCDVGFQMEDSLDIIFDHSIAQANTGIGVSFAGAASDTFVSCFSTAIANGSHGFYVNGLNTIFKNCVSTDNGGAGFFLDANTNKCIFEICLSTNNDFGLQVNPAVQVVNIYDSYFKGNNTDIVNPGNVALFVNIDTALEILCSKIEALNFDCICSSQDSLTSATDAIISKIDDCCSHLTSVIDNSTTTVSVIENTVTSLIDQSTETIVSKIEDCCNMLMSSIDNQTCTVSIIDNTLTSLIDNSTNEIFSKIEECCNMLMSSIDNQTCTVSIIDNTLTSLIDNSTDEIFSKIEECCGMIISAIDNQTNTVSIIDNTLTSLIDNSTNEIFSKIEECCGMILSAVDNQTNTVSIIDNTLTSLIDNSTNEIFSKIEECCGMILSAVDNQTNTVSIIDTTLASLIDNATDVIVSTIDNCCDHLTSQLDDIELKIDLIGGSALEAVVMQVEFLNSVLEEIIDTSLEISSILSAVEEISQDILFNLSNLDVLFEATISTVDACCMSLTDAINESTDDIFSKIEECCGMIISAVDNQTNTVSIIDNTLTSLIDNSTDEIFSKIEECCGMIISAVDNQVCTVSAIDSTITSIIDLSTDALFSKIDMCCASILDAVNAGAAMTCSCADIVGEELLSLIESISIQLGDTRIINEFNGPQVIINPGLYTLSSDFMMTSPGEYTFNITAPDVIIDLNNFTIDGNGTSLGGIQVDGVANVTIRNGSIVNSGGIAINITNAMNVLIENVTVNGTATPGGATIVIDSSTLVQLKNVLAFNESGGSVVSIVNSSNTLVQDSTGKSSTGGGFPAGIFSAVGSLATRFVNAIACSPFGLPSTAIGFGISGSTGVGFFGSSAINCDVGFQMEDSLDIIFDHSIAQANTGIGVSFAGAASDTFVSCFSTAIANGSHGFYVNGLNTIFKNCVSTDNGGAGFFLDANTNKCIFEICLSTNNDFGLQVNPAVQVVNIYDSYFKGNNTDIVNPGNVALFVNIDTALEILCSKIEELNFDCICSTQDNLTSMTDMIFSKIEECCGMILSAVDNQTNTVSIIDNTIAALIDNATDEIFSKIEECCDMILSAVDNQTGTISNIDGLRELIISVSDALTDDIADVQADLDCIVGTTITTVPFTITTPGLYSMCGNLTHTGVTPAITIAADNVTLDLGGYTLTTTGVGSRGIIASGRADVVIKNGSIRPNREAIVIDTNSNAVTIEDIVVYRPADIGIRIENSRGTIIRRCSVNGANGNTTGATNPSAFWFGVTAVGPIGLDAVVTDCVVTGNTDIGAQVRGFTFHSSLAYTRSRLLIENAEVGFTSNSGYLISDQGDGSFTFVNCQSSLATTNGFEYTRTAGTALSEVVFDTCRALSNVTNGFSISGINEAVFRNCVAYNNTLAGFTLTSTSVNGTTFDTCIAESNGTGFAITGVDTLCFMCKAVDNTGTGFAINTGANNTVIKKCASTTNATGVSIAAGVTGTLIYDSCVVNNTTNINDLGTGTVIINLQTINNAITAIDTSIDCLVGTPISTVPFTISTPGLYTLCSNLTHVAAATPAITIAASDVTLDLGGHTLTTTFTGSRGIQVNAGLSNIAIRNGSIRSNREAVSLDTNTGVTIEDLQIYRPGDIGVRVESSRGVIINRCSVVGFNGSATGATNPSAFWFGISTPAPGRLEAVVTDCTVSGESTIGVQQRGFSFIAANTYLESSLEFVNCSVHRVAASGFSITDQGDGAFSFINCEATTGSANGFEYTRTAGTAVSEVVFDTCRALSNATNGFSISGINEAVFRNCVAYNNTLAGFTLTSTSVNGATFDNCIAESNATGYSITGVDTLCFMCKAVDNTGTGFAINTGANRTTIKKCASTTNATGISIAAGVTGTLIYDSCVYNNTTNINDLGTGTVIINLQTINNAITALDESIDCLVGTPITTVPFTISTPGLYTLCTNLTYSAAATPAITIAASDVTLNLAGHTLTTTFVGSRGIQVGAGLSNIAIRNGSIRPNREAISLDTNTSVTIEDLQINRPGDIAIRVESCRDVVINRCSVFGFNGSGTGATNPAAFWFGLSMLVPGKLQAIITDCLVSCDSTVGFQQRGFAFVSANTFTESGVQFVNCSSHGTLSAGFSVTDQGNGSFTFLNCESTIAGTNGFEYIRPGLTPFASEVVFDSCRSLSNTTNGFSITGSNDAVFKNCVGYNNTDAGFNLTNASVNGVTFDNCISESNARGFAISGVDTLFFMCKAVDNTGTGFVINVGANRTTIKKCASTTNATGVSIAFGVTGTVIYDSCIVNNTGTNITDLGTGTEIVNLETIDQQLSCLVGTPITSVPFTITFPGLYTLCDSFTVTGATPAITINADDVTLDLAGHTLTQSAVGPAITGAIVVAANAQNFNIGNGLITVGAFGAGIVLNNTGTNTNGYIHDIAVRGTSASSGNGITINNSTGLTVENCQFDLVSNGIAVTGNSDAFTIKDCVVINPLANGINCNSITALGYELIRCNVFGAAAFGINLNSSAQALAQECKAIACTSGGFNVATPFSVLRGCAAMKNATVGYNIIGNGSVLEDCVATENTGIGFSMSSTITLNVTLRNCTATTNTAAGFFVSSDQTVVEGCISAQNGGSGFSSLRPGVSQIDFRECTATRNGADGFVMQQGGNVLKDCYAGHNQGRGLNDQGFAQVILDTRSALNALADAVAASVVITY